MTRRTDAPAVRHVVVLCAAFLLGGACTAPDAEQARAMARPPAPALGAPAPAYRIATLGGDSLVLGPSPRVVLLNVWATWCTSCKAEFAHMDSLLARHARNGLRVVAVSVDVGETALVQETLSSYAVSFEAAHDQAGEIETRFPAFGVPASYLIDRAGVLRWRHVGVLPTTVDSVVAALVRETTDGASVSTPPVRLPPVEAAAAGSPAPLADGAGGQ